LGEGWKGNMGAPKGGCEICSLSARADRRGDALATIACRSGPEFLKRCPACGSIWLETLRFEQWLAESDAVEQFGEPLSEGWWSNRLVEATATWETWGRNQTLYLTEPWTADSALIVVTVLPDDTLPILRHGASFAYFIEAAIAREFIEDFVSSQCTAPDARHIANRLIHYAENDS
jgi:hypothetical protein